MSRVGIFAGSFDPVHDGHIEFALAAVRKAKLDKVYFLPEPVHRNKQGTSHLAHRLAMLKLAIKGKPKLAVLELPDKHFTVAKTLPRLNHKFANADLYLLAGSDVLQHLPDWPLIDTLLMRMNLIVSRRASNTEKEVKIRVSKLSAQTQQILTITSPRPNLSSWQIRQDILQGKKTAGLNPAVAEYIKYNWLYVSPANASSDS